MEDIQAGGIPAQATEAAQIQTAPVVQETLLATETKQQPTGGWYESIKDEYLRGFVETKGFDSVDKLAQSYQHAEKLLGDKVSSLIIPPADAPAEVLNEFYSKLGRPEKSTDYNLGLPDGADKSFADAISNTMHEAGLTAAQAEKIGKQYNEIAAKQIAAMEQQRQVQYDNELTSLKNEWAQNYDKNLELARRAARNLGVDDSMAEKIQSAVGVKGMLSLFNKIGSGFSEDKFMVGGAQTSPFGMSVEAAKATLQEYKTNPTLRQAYLSGDVKAKAELENANRIIAGAK